MLDYFGYLFVYYIYINLFFIFPPELRCEQQFRKSSRYLFSSFVCVCVF